MLENPVPTPINAPDPVIITLLVISTLPFSVCSSDALSPIVALPVELNVVIPVMLPPVITALPDEKFVATRVLDAPVIPVMLPPVITALPDEKFVATRVLDAPVIPVILPPVIRALPDEKFVATK
jgi:hypothetical protein